jgi:hypothetical protein
VSVERDQDLLDRVERKFRRGRIALATQVTNLQVTFNAQTKAAEVTFLITSLLGLARIQLLRNLSRDPGSARVMQEWSYESLNSGPGQTFPISAAYTDGDQAIIGQKANYWLKIVPASDPENAQLVGPQLLDQSFAATGVPSQMVDFDASHAAGSGGVVSISVNAQPPTDGSFASLKIYVTGYQGSASAVAVAQQPSTSFSFNLQQTGENVTLTAVAVSISGTEAAIGGAPTKALTLTAGATVPVKPMNASATETVGGVQISFPANPEAGITNYLVYRGQRQTGFANAAQIGTVAPSGSRAYLFLDVNGLTGRFEWFIVAVNAIGNSAASSAIVQVQSQLSSSGDPGNVPSNTTNFATVDSIDAGADATIRVYGTGGVGSSWTRQTGFGTETYPAGTILHKSYSTTYWVVYDKVGLQYLVFSSSPQALGDNYAFAGSVITVAAGGSGGSSGGGGTNGGNTGGNKLPRT